MRYFYNFWGNKEPEPITIGDRRDKIITKPFDCLALRKRERGWKIKAKETEWEEVANKRKKILRKDAESPLEISV
jgi:hypothetical protein